MQVTLYGFVGSNACLATELLLSHAGITPTHHRLRPLQHVAALKLRGFAGFTVPAARIDGVRVQGSRRIARIVADAYPELGLLPTTDAPQARQRVLDAERSAERFQVATRRIVYGLAQDHPHVVRPLVDATWGFLPAPARAAFTRLLIAGAVRGHKAPRSVTQYELERAGGLLDEFDALVADGVMGGEQPNVADLQLAPNLTLLAVAPELRRELEVRPCWQIAQRWCPSYPLELSASVPQAWADVLASSGEGELRRT